MTPPEFEKLTGLSGRACAELLGVSSGKWSEYHSGVRETPRYIQRSMEAHALLHRNGLLAAWVAAVLSHRTGKAR